MRRIEFASPRVEVHMRASDPAHRDAVCSTIDGGCATSRSKFAEALNLALRPTLDTPLAVRACLPYTLPIPPAPWWQPTIDV